MERGRVDMQRLCLRVGHGPDLRTRTGQFGKGLALLRFQVSAPVAPLATFILARLGERVDGSLGKGDRGRNPVAA
jgi:hypothetical protein